MSQSKLEALSSPCRLNGFLRIGKLETTVREGLCRTAGDNLCPSAMRRGKDSLNLPNQTVGIAFMQSVSNAASRGQNFHNRLPPELHCGRFFVARDVEEDQLPIRTQCEICQYPRMRLSFGQITQKKDFRPPTQQSMDLGAEINGRNIALSRSTYQFRRMPQMHCKEPDTLLDL